jgi:hypothetical protein
MKQQALLLLAATFSSLGIAQQTELRGPVTGFIYERTTRSLRPVLGVLGAAHIGGAVLSAVDAAAVSPNGRIALAVADQELIRLDLSTGERLGISSAVAGDRIIWNKASTAALIAEASTGRLSLWEPSNGLTALADVPGTITAAAVSDSGDAAVASADGVYAVTRAGGPRLIAAVQELGGLTVQAGDLLFADRGSNSIFRVRDFASSASVEKVSDAPAGATGLGLSRDGETLFVASSESRSVRAMRLATGEIAGEIALDFTPSAVEPLSASAYLLNPGATGPLQVLDARAQAAVYFVPAAEVN